MFFDYIFIINIIINCCLIFNIYFFKIFRLDALFGDQVRVGKMRQGVLHPGTAHWNPFGQRP